MKFPTMFCLCLVLCVTSTASVPSPTVTGPIPAAVLPGDPSHDYPFFSTTVDLASYGYVEEEFFLEGAANRYNTPALMTGSVIDGGHPYRTRIIVRRPSRPNNFNGTVLMEWQNVTGNYEPDAVWLMCHDHFLRRGYAWIGVSAQRASIHSPVTGLKAWSPTRYGTLDVTQGGTILNDALSFDIFSQAAQAARSPQGIDPMGGLPVKWVIATGWSQSAGYITTYHNSIHPLAGVFDAFLVVMGGGIAPGGGRLRADLDVKVLRFMSESEIAGTHGGISQLQEQDSDHFRRWEVAGGNTLDYHSAQEVSPLIARDLGGSFSPQCDLPPFSRIPAYFAANAAIDHLVRWVQDNITPPRAPGIEIVTLGPPVVIARDAYGNALGGIRLSQHGVATATNTGVNSGPGNCRYLGSFQSFDQGTLNALYPNHGRYVSQVAQSTNENLRDGFIVIEDAILTVQIAAGSQFGR